MPWMLFGCYLDAIWMLFGCRFGCRFMKELTSLISNDCDFYLECESICKQTEAKIECDNDDK